MALLLGVVGIYGVIAYSISQASSAALPAQLH